MWYFSKYWLILWTSWLCVKSCNGACFIVGAVSEIQRKDSFEMFEDFNIGNQGTKKVCYNWPDCLLHVKEAASIQGGGG